MKIHTLLLIGTIALLFTSCVNGYKIKGDTVYYYYANEGSGQHRRALMADAKTFKVLAYDAYAADAHTVFFEGEPIKGADAASFEAVSPFYAHDKHLAWYGKDTIKTANGATFKRINNYYSTDGKDVFYTTEPLQVRNVNQFKFIQGENTFATWATDGSFYYYNAAKIPSSDYAHLIIYPESGGLASDRYDAYFMDHRLNYNLEGKKVIDTIDIGSFKVNGYLSCRDKLGCINVYHGRMKCGE